jgi:hypothetical protein
MVYVYSGTLQMTPVNPYNTDQLSFSAYIGFDLGNLACPFGVDLGYTRTSIHLLQRNVSTQPLWTNATKVATIDCTTQCCLDTENDTAVPGHSGSLGWEVVFPSFNAPATGTYEYLAVDDADYKNTYYPENRVSKLQIIISQDPSDPCYEDHCAYGCPDASKCGMCGNPECTGDECASGDYMCQIIDYVKKNPLVAIVGAFIAVMVLMPPKRK